MPIKFIAVLYFNLLLGMAGIYFSARHKDPVSSAGLWKKFAVYVAIIHFIMLSVLYCRPLYNMAIMLLLLTGGYEIVKATNGNSTLRYRAVFSFLIFAFGFLLFTLRSSSVTIISVYTIVLLFDGFSQVSGQLFGRHKLAPAISPNKTVEGLAGGMLVAVATYLLVTDVHQSVLSFVAIALIVTASLAGDLLASQVKRMAGVKDYSAIIPYHGGVLDRFDSFIVAGSMAWLLSFCNFVF